MSGGPGRGCGLVSALRVEIYKPGFPEGMKFTGRDYGQAVRAWVSVVYDYVIEYFNIKHLSGLDQFPRHFEVFGAGAGVAAGVIVGEYDGSGITSNGGAKDFASVYEGGVQDSLRHNLRGFDVASDVEHQNAKLFHLGIIFGAGGDVAGIDRGGISGAVHCSHGSAFAYKADPHKFDTLCKHIHLFGFHDITNPARSST